MLWWPHRGLIHRPGDCESSVPLAVPLAVSGAAVPRRGHIYWNAGGGTGQGTHPVTFDLLYRPRREPELGNAS